VRNEKVAGKTNRPNVGPARLATSKSQCEAYMPCDFFFLFFFFAIALLLDAPLPIETLTHYK
jgi:hypothetical protein